MYERLGIVAHTVGYKFKMNTKNVNAIGTRAHNAQNIK